MSNYLNSNSDIKTEIFSTPIWGVVLNNQLDKTEDYIKKILELEQTQKSQKKSNFGGFQSKDNIQNDRTFQELVKIIETVANELILPEYNCFSAKITEMWANVNRKNNFNYSHIHSGILSGVFYLHVPKNSGSLIFLPPAVRSDSHLIRSDNYKITPKFLSCIFFPPWLEHFVEPNLSDDFRISISFNIGQKI